ncbi:hypothetical protein R3X25_14970 [Lutibacter sp. TH_r2]|uniref:hypothetical protein n=1 Tax=Lutibacter sp. TH_r2 TaxID=3082083 RepID=UPI0029530BE8|nr:hypothetical protein [Lutibacter sp. TH_r2]MDV7188587.1 hypothetical protein [Lutibacter sp. TH_r2]
MKISIPGNKNFNIKNLVLDYNGTIANNGQLIIGVEKAINTLSKEIKIYVITADTFGTVETELKNANCKILKIGKENQNQQKLDLILKLNPNNTVSFGNGKNDELILKESAIGIGILENEGIYAKNLLNADILSAKTF